MQGNSNSVPKGKLSKHIQQGVLFITYSLLVSGAKQWASKNNDEDSQLEATVSKDSRLGQIIEWLGDGAGDPIIVLDECHKAKNLLATSKGQERAFQSV